MDRTPVLFCDPLRPAEAGAARRMLEAEGFAFAALDGGGDPSAAVAAAEIMVVKRFAVTAEVLRSARRLRLLQKMGNSLRNVDLPAAHSAGVAVARWRMPEWIALGEHVLMLMLALNRRLLRGHAAVVNAAYRALDVTPMETDERVHAFNWMRLDLDILYGKTLGIVGVGEIGSEVALHAAGFGLRLLYHDVVPLAASEERELGVQLVPLERLFGESDFVTLHIPHVPSNDRIVNGDLLRLMKPTAFLINTCRGGVVDEEALVEALASRRIAGAGLDVFRWEPLPADSPLLRLDNVVLTPHVASAPSRGFVGRLEMVMENLRRYRRGEPVLNLAPA
ncbi:MAG: D-glycerate dehydrogenase [Armatimonadetes bacterium]|nr:D-glycerate dehydrogenase [Armatimonadota bacterium]